LTDINGSGTCAKSQAGQTAQGKPAQEIQNSAEVATWRSPVNWSLFSPTWVKLVQPLPTTPGAGYWLATKWIPELPGY
jgi:hypothetical protein